MNKIGNKIRVMRESIGMSQEYIATEIGITQPSYARLEKEDDRISITRLIHIAHILKTTVASLIDEQAQKIINQQHSENPTAYNVDSIGTVYHADKEHIQSLKEEIDFLKSIIKTSNKS